MTRANISKIEYFCIIPCILFGKAIGHTAGIIARQIGGDVWISMSLGFGIGTVILLAMSYLCSRFPEKTIIQAAEAVAGKWAARTIGFILAVFFAFAFSACANVMIMHVQEYFLTQTPYAVIALVYLLLCMYGVFLGIEVIARFALIGFVFSVAITFTMITGTFGDFELINLLPLFDRGIALDLAGSIYFFGDLAMLTLAVGILYPMMGSQNKVMPLSFWAMFISFLLVVIWPFFEQGVMGTGAMKQYVVVCMQQIRCAQLTRYLPRYELIMVSFFTFGVFVQAAVMYFCTAHSLKQISGLKSNGYIILALGAFLYFITYYIGHDHNNYVLFLTYPWPQICAILSIGLPFLIFLIALLRRKLPKPQGKQVPA